MRWMIDNSSRVTRIVDARGHIQLARDKATLQTEILKILGLRRCTRTALMRELQTSQRLISHVLDGLATEGRVENFQALSIRKRLDIFWCLPGEQPMKAPGTTSRFKAAETLVAMQAHAFCLVAAGVTP